MHQDALEAGGLSGTVRVPLVAVLDHQDSARVHTPAARLPSAVDPIGRWLDRWMLPIYLTFFLLVYSPAILISYGYLDDYSTLAVFVEHGGAAANNTLLALVVGGRPTLALLTDIFFAPAQSLGDLQVMRCLGVVTIGALAWLLYHALRKVGARWPLATFTPLLICVTPPFQIMAGWAVTSFFPLAALLAGIAALLVDHSAARAWKRGAGLLLAALALETLALTVYQPAAMMFWVFAAIFLVMRVYAPRPFIWRTAIFVAIGVTASGLDFALIKLLPRVGVVNYGAARTTLSTDLKAKLVWFALHPLASALNVWSLRPSLALGVGVVVFSALGVALYVSGDWRVKALKLAVLVAFIPATFLPNLAVSEESGPYRTQIALMALVVVCLCLACSGYAGALRRYVTSARSRQVFERGMMVTGLLASLMLSSLACSNVAQDIAIPDYIESAMIQSQLRAIDLSSTSALYVRMSCLSDSAAPIARFDEIGLPSTSIIWDVQPMIVVELREINPAYASIPIVVEAPEASFTVPVGSSELDARSLSLYRNHQPWTYGPLQPC